MAATAHPAVPAAETPAGSSTRNSGRTRLEAVSAITRAISLWHLLSVDAPTVAMLWTWFLASADHIRLPAIDLLAMGIAVWTLYAADRLLDSRSIKFFVLGDRGPAAVTPTRSAARPQNPLILLDPPASASTELEPRHYFHRNHQRAFRWGILLASIAITLLVPHMSPQSVRLYIILGTLLAGYFILIHVNFAATPTKSHRLPKELAVGVFFSAATFIPTIADDPGRRHALVPGAILFAVLCSLNCLFIYTWEHPFSESGTGSQRRALTHPATRIALGFLPQLTGAVAVIGLVVALTDRSLPWPIPTACAFSAVLLLLLDRNRHRFSPTVLRAAADLCLLTPVLFLFS